MWEMFEQPGHERELKRFGLAMTIGKEFDPVEELLACTFLYWSAFSDRWRRSDKTS